MPTIPTGSGLRNRIGHLAVEDAEAVAAKVAEIAIEYKVKIGIFAKRRPWV
jgi:hypothetical protein